MESHRSFMITLAKLLTLCIWIGTAALIMLLYRIAHFYQVTTGLRSHYRFFLVPVILFLAGMLRYLIIDTRIAGDIIGDLLFFLGGVSLSLIGYFLLKLMTGGR
jgi:hypothetical protein